MSVSTEADDLLDATDRHIADAVECLSSVVVGRCWGFDGYTPEYSEKVRSVYYDLIEMRLALDRSRNA